MQQNKIQSIANCSPAYIREGQLLCFFSLYHTISSHVILNTRRCIFSSRYANRLCCLNDLDKIGLTCLSLLVEHCQLILQYSHIPGKVIQSLKFTKDRIRWGDGSGGKVCLLHSENGSPNKFCFQFFGTHET